MWWDFFALVSALLWALGTLWAMITDLRSVSRQQEDLLRALGEIAREEAEAELEKKRLARKAFGQWRDLLEIRYLTQATETISESEYESIRTYYHKILSWFTLCCAGAAGIIASSRPFLP